MSGAAPRRLSTSQVAARLGLSPRTVLRYIHAGCLPSIRTPARAKQGYRYRIAESDLRALEERLRTPTAEADSAPPRAAVD